MLKSTILDSLGFAREYTISLLADIPDDQWFAMPGGVSHVAWQVGHLINAELFLCLNRIRGPLPIDDEIYHPDIRKPFSRTSDPSADASLYPAPARIRELLDRVHAHVLAEIPKYDEALLSEPLAAPHRICRTKGDCLIWAPRHELIHAGQIALLRRQLGHKPQW